MKICGGIIMPALKTQKNKTLFGYQVDKENDDVIYSDAEHVYLSKVDGSKYISVTTLIGEYENKFNESFFSKYKALEALADPDHFSLIKQGLLSTQIWNNQILEKLGIEEVKFNDKVKEILETWHNTRDEACDHGSMVHSILEESFYGREHFDLSNYESPQIVGNYVCNPGYYTLDIEHGIYPEYLISWITPEGLKISGQIDLIVRNGNDISIYDYKTNKEIKKKSFFNTTKKRNVMMKYPLNNIMDCNFWHYSLQLSLYAYLVEKVNPELNIKELKLIHIARDGKQTIYDVEYLKSDIERMLKHYAKSLKTNELLDRDVPYII